MQGWIDVHVHLDRLEHSPQEGLDLALKNNVNRIITIGTEMSDLPTVIELAEKYAPYVFGTLGVHPHEGKTYTPEVEKFIRGNITHPRIVAVGEIGLDYYYEHSNKPEQIEAFEKQLQIAKEFKMPVEIHTRDAEADTVELLKKFKGSVNGLIHCFTGTEWLAKECLDLGFNISISGVVTFKNADSLREVVKMVPLDRLHIETDSPFLAPVPHRGKKCTPSFVVHTAETVAMLKGISLEKLSDATWQNTMKLFPKMK